MTQPKRPVNRIFPGNLTAKAAYNVTGNPPSTRPESGVSNCFPGLEYDHRNLDRRFFPGLVIAFASAGDPSTAIRQGARVIEVDTGDPGLRPTDPSAQALVPALRQALNDLSGRLDDATLWFVSTIEQDGVTIALVDDQKAPLDGSIIWRLVRSLRPGPVTIVVEQRSQSPAPADGATAGTIELAGWRRRYTDATTGVIDMSFQPGELTQSLCSPWMHDFRDCSCTYWASNHPDIVLAPLPPGDTTLPGGEPDDPISLTRLGWLRDPRLPELSAQAGRTQGVDRPFEISYYEINSDWQDLAVVLENREVDDLYFPRSRAADNANPFPTSEELLDHIRRLAGLEHLVALLYLYARFSLLDRGQAEAFARDQGRWPTLPDDVEFARHVLLEVATGEMQHLRWANQLLWGLAEATHQPYHPVIVPPALVIPTAAAGRPAELAPLTPATLAQFIDIERSSSFIDGQYARVTATLRQSGYPPNLYQLAANIVEEGEQHFLHFLDVQRILAGYGDNRPVYLRSVEPGDPADPEVAGALAVYQGITDDLITGYGFGDRQNQRDLATARALMFDLQDKAERLATKGVGIPFLSLFASS